VSKVIWLLDFDGVINAQRPPWGTAPRARTVHVASGGKVDHWRLRWAPELLDRIRAVDMLPHVEIRWSSTWCVPDDSGYPAVRLLETALVLPRWECAFDPGEHWTYETITAAKRLAALEVVQSGSRLVWTDDEHVPNSGSEVHQLLTQNGREALLIRPRAARGLTRGDLDKIEAFVEAGAT
jgi:hypothetical protein